MTAERPRKAIGEDGKLKVIGEADTDRIVKEAIGIAKAWPEAVEGEGGRQPTHTLAHRLMDIGCLPETAAAIMAEHWDDGNSPPWSDEALLDEVMSLLPSRQGSIGCAAIENTFERVKAANGSSSTSPPTRPKRWRSRVMGKS